MFIRKSWENVFSPSPILIITTGLLFLYGLGRSIFENDIRETGNIIIEPLENGYRLAAEKTGDTAIGNFITALFFTGLVAVGALFFWGVLLGLPVVATFVTIIVLSIINVFKSIRIFQNDI